MSVFSTQISSLPARKATAQIAFVALESGSWDPFQSQSWHVHWSLTSLALVCFQQKAKRWLPRLYLVSLFSDLLRGVWTKCFPWYPGLPLELFIPPLPPSSFIRIMPGFGLCPCLSLLPAVRLWREDSVSLNAVII